MARFSVGDKVRVKNFIHSKVVMVEDMLELYGGKIVTISSVDKAGGLFAYKIAEDIWGYEFSEYDLEEISILPPKTQRMEVPVPGGHLVAEAFNGGDYPCIYLSFIPSGEDVEHSLCFAEVNVEDDPNNVRVGVFYREYEDVRDFYDFPMVKEADE